MNKQPVYMSQTPEGCEVQGSGGNADRVTSVSMVNTGPNIEPVQFSGIEYERETDRFCTANDNTCKAPRANGTEFCIGHLRAHLKKQTEQGE